MLIYTVFFRELGVTWSNMEFDYEEHDRTKMNMPKASEDLIETLEDNQVNFFHLIYLYPMKSSLKYLRISINELHYSAKLTCNLDKYFILIRN